jgi:lysozyme family protein
MAVANFDLCLPPLLKHEEGYVNHPNDPGGATNMGITHKTLAAWRKVPSVTPAEVKALQLVEVKQIYRAQYWNPIKGDQLPLGLDYAVFDFAVNSGVGRAIRMLQQELKARALYDGAIDGIIGVKSLNALTAIDDREELIRSYMSRRLTFLKKLKGWSTFGRGWQRRVDEVLNLALDMFEGKAVATAVVKPTQISDCRTPHDVAGACDVSAIKSVEGQGATGIGVGTAGAALSEAAAQIQPLADVNADIKWVFIGLLVAGVAVTLYSSLRSLNRQNEGQVA